MSNKLAIETIKCNLMNLFLSLSNHIHAYIDLQSDVCHENVGNMYNQFLKKLKYMCQLCFVANTDLCNMFIAVSDREYSFITA